MATDNRQDRELEVRETFTRPEAWAPASALPDIKK
jgi:hypothetical protein